MSMTEAVKPRVGIVGVGEMGRPLIVRLKRMGYDVLAYARREEVKKDLETAGVPTVGSLAEMAKGRDFVIIYVYTDDQVLQVALDDGLVDAMEPGSMLIIHTTGSPTTTRTIAAHGNRRGVQVVDVGGSGSPAALARGAVTWMVGGEPEEFARCRPLLEAYGHPVFHVGPLGSGMALKLINNALLGAHVQLARDACEAGKSQGIDPNTLLSILGHCSGASYGQEAVAAAPTEADFMRSLGRFIYKDVSVATKAASELGIDLGMIAAANEPLMASLEAGGAHD